MEPTDTAEHATAAPGAGATLAEQPASPWASSPQLRGPRSARRAARNASGAEVPLAPRADAAQLAAALAAPTLGRAVAVAVAVVLAAAVAAWALLGGPSDQGPPPRPAGAPGDDASYQLPFSHAEHRHDDGTAGGVDATLDPATMDLPPAPTTTVFSAPAPTTQPDIGALAGLDLPERSALAAAPREVVVVGDSLTEGAAAHLADMLDDAGVPVRVDAARSRPTLDATEVLGRLAPQEGSLVVVALGTNDLPDPASYAQRIDRVLAAVPQHSRVMWLTLDRDGWGGVNEALADASQGRHHARLEVADWAEVAARHPGIRAADGVHYTDAGYRLRARFIANVALGLPTADL